MAKKQTALANTVLQISRVHFVYVFAYAALTLAYKAWKLIVPSALLQRWGVALIMLAVTTAVWSGAKLSDKATSFYQSLLWVLIILDIFVASFTVYSQRGMASRGVLLFCIPIVIAATLKKGSALFTTAALSAAAYSFAAIKYFYDHPSEGYKIELYGDVAFYSALFFVLAALLSVLITRSRSANS